MDRMREQNAAGRTIVSFLLDRTGWMDPVKVETVNAVNAFLQMLETEAGDLVDSSRCCNTTASAPTRSASAPNSPTCRA
jgi:hypothetical protein